MRGGRYSFPASGSGEARVPSAGPAGEESRDLPAETFGQLLEPRLDLRAKTARLLPVEQGFGVEEVVIERRTDDAVGRGGDRADERRRRAPSLEDVEDLVEQRVAHERLASDRRRPRLLIRAARALASSRVVPAGSAAR